LDYSLKIGGEAGQGIQTVGDTLAKVFSRAGYHVFTHQDYESRIRGGHNFFQIRFSDKPLTASRDGIDIIVGLDKESISLHAKELTPNGIIIYDSDMTGNPPVPSPEDEAEKKFLNIPFVSLATEHGGSRIMANIVATGAVLGMLRLDPDILSGIIEETFKKKGEGTINANMKAARSGYDFTVKSCQQCSFSVAPLSEPKMLIAGIEAIALGAIASGCKFYSAYPMTPSTGIMNYLAGKGQEYGIVVEQAEDEISAINMALGASFAGVRAMTGTSGGGFALMVEGLSLAGMTETPVVIAIGQRPGPATGLPTRTEQAELLFVLHAGHGEFPRVIFAPGSPEQAFYLTNKAFDIAEKYQVPAFVVFDQYLADSEWTYTGFDPGKTVYKDYRMREDQLKKLSDYKRHALTDTGVSPLGIPGDSRHLIVTDSDEHDEDGHIIEDAETRIKMVEKRLLRKLPVLRKEIQSPSLYGSSQPEIVIAGWGSTFGVMREVTDLLAKDENIAMLHFSEVYPFPAGEDYMNVLRNANLSVCIENNATGQFARLMRMETGFEFKARINKYDGRPFTVEGLLARVRKII